MKNTAAVLFLLMTASTCVYAQDSLVGKYSGSYTFRTFRGGDEQFGLDLTIATAEGGKLTGTAYVHAKACRGEYPMVGKYFDNKVFMRATAKGGPSGDCGLGFRLTVEGNKLVGETGNGLPVELTRGSSP